MPAFKNFLIISSYAPPAISGSSMMMYNILKYFPENSFSILTTHFGMTDKVVNKGQWLKAKYFYFDSALASTTAAVQKKESTFKKIERVIRKFKLFYFIYHTAVFFYLPINIIRYGKKIIKKEKIELLLGYSDFGPALFSAYILHKITKVPFYLYFYDLYYGNNFPFFQNLFARFFEPKLFKDAEKIFVMSEALQEHYQNKYKREIIVIHNSLPIKDAVRNDIKKNSDTYKIVFTGAIYWAQAGAIKNLIKAINELKDFKIQFWIYCPRDKTKINEEGIFESDRVILSSGMPSEMPDIQRSADILFVPLAFNTKMDLLIDTSSPGKTYEYLLSGRPILIHAPSTSYIYKYAKKYNFAVTVGEEDIEKLKKAIMDLITNKKMAKMLTSNALATAKMNHDAAKNSSFFQKFFLNEFKK